MSLIWGHAATAQTINRSSFGDGLQFEAADSSFSLIFSTRFQTLYAGSQNPETGNWEDRLLIRRFRLKFDGYAYSKRLEYKIELGLSNSDIGSRLLRQHNQADNIILDAVAKWRMTPTLSLWAGQTKLPGNRERVISSQELQFVDRSILNANITLDRDVGLQFRNQHSIGQVVLREIFSISMGEGRNVTVESGGGYAYTARAEVLPFGQFEGKGDYVQSDIFREQTPKLSLAATYDYNDDATRSNGQLGAFLSGERDLSTLFVDAMFKYRGFSSMAEYANRQAPGGPVVSREDNGAVDEIFVTGSALNVQAGYLFKSNWEVAGRYSAFDPTAVLELTPEQQFTIAVSRYIVGHNLKVQSDFSLINTPESETQYQFRLQMELSL